jgi:two-component system cell cycle response regulator
MTEGTKPIILIVDDDSSTLAALERLFRNHFHVLSSQSAEEALQHIEKHTDIAVVLSDYQLPSISGLDFLKQIHVTNPTTIKIILTGVLDTSELTQAMNQKILHRVFRKPWENDFLILQMTEAIQQHQMLLDRENYEKLSLTDPITGLFNQRHFQNHLSIELERAKRHNRIISLIMIDIDLFKTFNDTKGHPEGNKLLQAVASILKESVRNIDLVFRYAGDEFALLLPDTDKSRATEVAERVRQKVEAQLAGATLSLGVATFPEDANNYDELVLKADQALYQAKRSGKNQTVVAGKD